MADESDWLEDRPFYEAMQRYRHAPAVDQSEVVAAFEAVKEMVRAELAKPDARPAPAEPQPTEAEKDAAFLGRLRDRSESWQAYSATAPQPAGGEREAFEAWCSKRGQDYERLGDGYTNDLVQRTWQGWQARADLSLMGTEHAAVTGRLSEGLGGWLLNAKDLGCRR